MKNGIVAVFILYMIVPITVFSDDNKITYIWVFDYNDNSFGGMFSDTLRSKFESALQECNKTSFVTRLTSENIMSSAYKTLLPPDYSILVENQANYLIRGAIWKPDNKNPINVSIKLYCRINTENIALSTFHYSSEFVMKSRGIDLIVLSLMSEICPAFKVDDIQRISKAEELFIQKKKYLDEYKRMIDSLQQSVKPIEYLHATDTVICEKIVYDTIINNNTSAADLLIPGYSLLTSINKKQNVIHSLIFNVSAIGSLAGGVIFWSMSENDRYIRDASRFKTYGNILLVTSSVSAIINGFVVAIQIKKKK